MTSSEREGIGVSVRAYGQVRHALQYLRREKNDAERYAPSLYGHRRTPKAKALAVAVRVRPRRKQRGAKTAAIKWRLQRKAGKRRGGDQPVASLARRELGMLRGKPR